MPPASPNPGCASGDVCTESIATRRTSRRPCVPPTLKHLHPVANRRRPGRIPDHPPSGTAEGLAPARTGREPFSGWYGRETARSSAGTGPAVLEAARTGPDDVVHLRRGRVGVGAARPG